jgi:ribosomal protein L37E
MSNTADWFAKKLQQQQPPAPAARTQSVPLAPSQVPMTPMPAPQASNPAAKAQSASKVETCPDCGSSNYYGFNGSKPRCYECGYPMEQSGSKYGSLTGARVVGDTKGARGNDSTNNYNPQGIIGRID